MNPSAAQLPRKAALLSRQESERAYARGYDEAMRRPMGLTVQQARCLETIKQKIVQYGRPPSLLELQWALGLNSKSGVFRLVNALEERGHIVRLKNRARSIMVVEPMHVCPNCGHEFQVNGK